MKIGLTCPNCGAFTNGPEVDASGINPVLRRMILEFIEPYLPPCAGCATQRKLSESEAEPPATEEPRPRRKVGPEAGQ